MEENQNQPKATDPTAQAGLSTKDSSTAAASGPAVVNANQDMHIKISSPFKVYFDDRAKSISALNDTGPFDILAGHRNFMTLVSPCEMVIRKTDGSEEKIKIARAVMHVKADEVTVFLDV